jgi:hypothetical protein
MSLKPVNFKLGMDVLGGLLILTDKFSLG